MENAETILNHIKNPAETLPKCRNPHLPKLPKPCQNYSKHIVKSCRNLSQDFGEVLASNLKWNKYKNHLKSLLEKRKAFGYIETHGRNENTLNELWDIICNCIQQASLKHIPHKKVGGTKTNLNRNYKEIEDSSKERKDLLYIRSIMRKLYKNELKGTELIKASEGIKLFNQRYG